MGPEFISVRKSIRELGAVSLSKPNVSPRIVIVGGGTDPYKFAPALVNFLSKTNLEFHATVFSNRIDAVSSDVRFNFFEPASEVKHAIKTADVIFCTGGTMSWEMLSAGFAIGIALATTNQELNFYYQETQLILHLFQIKMDY